MGSPLCHHLTISKKTKMLYGSSGLIELIVMREKDDFKVARNKPTCWGVVLSWNHNTHQKKKAASLIRFFFKTGIEHSS
jgi:hypothetical protein